MALGTKRPPRSFHLHPSETLQVGALSKCLLHPGMTPTAGTAQEPKGLYSSWQGVAAPDWLGQMAGSSS